MTEDELFAIVDKTMLSERRKIELKSAVRVYVKALIAAKPLVSGSLQDFIDDVEHMQKLYGNQRYTQAEEWRDKLAEKLDDVMRLGGNDR